MKKIFLMLPVLFFMLYSCASSQKAINQSDNQSYTVKIVNTSFDKVLLRYQRDDLSYTFQFVDQKSDIKFLMNGNLTIQYSQADFDDAKIIKIKQDTFIQIKENDIIIDDLPVAEKINPKNKVLEKTK